MRNSEDISHYCIQHRAITSTYMYVCICTKASIYLQFLKKLLRGNQKLTKYLAIAISKSISDSISESISESQGALNII